MKTFTITGLATEQSFTNGKNVHYFLVFNGGELRLPISEESAEIFVSAMVQTEEVHPIIDDYDNDVDEQYNAPQDDTDQI